MKVLYVWDADFPWDVRVEKICNTLNKEGHEVHIACRNLKKRPIYEEVAQLHIHRMSPWQNAHLNYYFSFPLFFSPFWKRFLDTIIMKHHVQLLIVRDLPLAITGIWAGRRHNIPVILDMAEDYVAMITDIWRSRKFQGFNLIVRNPYLAKYAERYAFEYADHIFVVVEEAIDVVINGGGNPDRITIVGNTPDHESFQKTINIPKDVYEQIVSHFSVIYTGGIQRGRGIQVILDAIPAIIKNIPNFQLVVVGDGYATQSMKKIIAEKSLQNYVLWLGWIEHDQIYDYIKACKVGIIPHYVTDHVNSTIPNKIFDYMGCGLPVIASDASPMKRILGQERCGVVFKSGDSKDFYLKLLELLPQLTEYGNNAKKAINQKYNWDIDRKRLFDTINAMFPITICEAKEI